MITDFRVYKKVAGFKKIYGVCSKLVSKKDPTKNQEQDMRQRASNFAIQTSGCYLGKIFLKPRLGINFIKTRPDCVFNKINIGLLVLKRI